jgi:hypothetical protein
LTKINPEEVAMMQQAVQLGTNTDWQTYLEEYLGTPHQIDFGVLSNLTDSQIALDFGLFWPDSYNPKSPEYGFLKKYGSRITITQVENPESKQPEYRTKITWHQKTGTTSLTEPQLEDKPIGESVTVPPLFANIFVQAPSTSVMFNAAQQLKGEFHNGAVITYSLWTQQSRQPSYTLINVPWLREQAGEVVTGVFEAFNKNGGYETYVMKGPSLTKFVEQHNK